MNSNRKKLRILIDPQTFTIQSQGGVSRYFTELVRIFKSNARIRIRFPILVSDNLHLKHYNLQPKFFPFLLKIRFIKSLVFRLGLYKWNKVYINFLLKNNWVDVFVPTYYDTYFLSSIGKVPFVLTVYDMIYELFPNYFSDATSIITNKKLLLENATKIIAISHHTKNDIVKIYPQIDPNKIEVVYLSHSVNEARISSTIQLPTEPYLLFVGNRYGYKNFTFFLNSVAAWIIQHNLNLLCLGGGNFSSDEINLFESLRINNRIKQVTFLDSEISTYYSNAFAFVFPSSYEGFGIPVLEAMACGCPVVLPYSSSFPEVAGEAGIFFELGNPDSIVNCLNLVMNDNEFRHKKITMGISQARKFSWEKTAEECLDVYRRAVS